MYGAGVTEDMVAPYVEASLSSDSPSDSLLYNLSVLKEKFHEVQSLVTIFISPDQRQPSGESTAMAIDSMGTLIQEITVTASSIMFACQQIGEERRQRFYSSDQTLQWNGESYNPCNTNNDNNNQSTITRSTNNKAGKSELLQKSSEIDEGRSSQGFPPKNNYEVIELNVEDLLAKYTHYCQVCGKGFKRDANLRMHMRAHGDEYKSSAALINPAKRIGRNKKDANSDLEEELPRKKYSCPQEGCRWNKKHAKFQPLKSMICAKNHYRRSHCPKMYVCQRCNGKQFSVLSDLRTHEKHCGDLKWQCSCGTTFSRKNKLLGHVALFGGHTPAIDISSRKMEKVEQFNHHPVPICE